jgi:hypothetical protein
MTNDPKNTNVPRRPFPIGPDSCVIPDPCKLPKLPSLPQSRRFPWDPMPSQGPMYGSAQTRARDIANLATQ